MLNYLGDEKPGRTKTLLIALVAVTVLVYLRGLVGQFVWDDRLFFLDNDILTSWRPWDLDKILFESSTYWRDHIPATNFLFTLEYNLFGRSTFGYHIISLILYIATGLLVFKLTHLLHVFAAEEGRLARKSVNEWGPYISAFLVTAFFMLHPVHVEVVSYITGQKDLLYGLFSLIALYGIAAFSSGRSTGKSGVLWLVVSAISYYLAFLSKAMAVSTAVFLPVFWLFFLRRRDEPVLRPILFWLALNLPAFGWAVYSLSGSVDLVAQLSTAGDRLLLGLKVLGAHVSVFLLPWPLNFGYPFNTTNSFDPTMLAGILFLVVTVAIVVKRPRSFVSIGLLCFLIFLLPILQLFVRIQNALIFDRYLYISVLGGAMVFERILVYASRHIRPSVALSAALGVFMLYAGLTAAYVPKFNSDIASLGHAYSIFPGWKRPAFDYEYALIEAGKLEEAERVAHAERTFDAPEWVRPYFLGWIMVERGKPYEALGYLELASYDAKIGGYFPFPDVQLGRAYMLLGKKHKARAALRRVMGLRTQNPLEYYKAKVMFYAIDSQVPQ